MGWNYGKQIQANYQKKFPDWKNHQQVKHASLLVSKQKPMYNTLADPELSQRLEQKTSEIPFDYDFMIL